MVCPEVSRSTVKLGMVMRNTPSGSGLVLVDAVVPAEVDVLVGFDAEDPAVVDPVMVTVVELAVLDVPDTCEVDVIAEVGAGALS